MKSKNILILLLASSLTLSACDDSTSNSEDLADLVDTQDQDPGDNSQQDLAADSDTTSQPDSATDLDTSTDTAQDLAPDTLTDTSPDTNTDASDDTPDQITPPDNYTSLPAVARGESYYGFEEAFNRYYTDSEWLPQQTLYVSPNGSGDGSSQASPAPVNQGLSAATPGTMVVFLAGEYDGCFELNQSQSGTYDAPVVLYGERNADDTLGVRINCCNSGRRTCINLEGANYVAVDGFELVGERYGVRAVGLGYAADEHQKGVAILNCHGHDQDADPFFSGQSDWLVIESCLAHDVGTADGHGIYLSNGSDWNVVRFNETFNTSSSDFQINADPISTCQDVGVAYDDPVCDALAGSHPTGGQGASDYILVEGNFFHHSQAQGPNFTSVRHSVMKNNLFILPQRHGTSFWQQTDNPDLGSSHNYVAHNLFITTTNYRQAIGLINNSTNNTFINNLVANLTISGNTISGNDRGLLMETDASTVEANTFINNGWLSGGFGATDASTPYQPNSGELRIENLDPAWFVAFPTDLGRDPEAFRPSSSAPWLSLGELLREVPVDLTGAHRNNPTALGPFEQ